MIESFITAFIIYFVVIDPIGSAPIFLAVTGAQNRARKMRTALEGTLVATKIRLFLAVCGAWILVYLNISETAFKIAGGIILFLVTIDMLAAKRQARKRVEGAGDSPADKIERDNLAIYPLIIPPMMINFGYRYTVLANLIRNLYDEVLGEHNSPQDAELLLLQIRRLRDRLRPIRIIQSCATMAVVLVLMAMIAAYFDERAISNMVFLVSISFLMVSMLMFTREIQIANMALDVHLSDLEQHQE